MKANFNPFQEELELGEFPGRISAEKGDNAPRIQAQISITVKDRVTGEKFQRMIPYETFEETKILPWIQAAVKHPRFVDDVNSFAKDRSSGGDDPESDDDRI